MIINPDEVVKMFFEGKSIEVYSSDLPSKSSTTEYSNVFCHILYPHKQIVKVLFVWTERRRKSLPNIIDFRVENIAGGYGNLRIPTHHYVNVIENHSPDNIKNDAT